VKRVDAEQARYAAGSAHAAHAPTVVSVVICDAHRIFAQALASLLYKAGHDIVGCEAELRQAAEAAGRLRADAFLLGLGGLASPRDAEIEQAVACAPQTAFVALATSADPVRIGRAVAAGVHGVALKTDDFGEIVRVLTTAVSGRRSRQLPPASVLSRCAQAALRSGRRIGGGPAPLLTCREHEALALLVHGENTTSIAASMGVRVSTARTHVNAVLTKLGVHSRLEAVAVAVREALVDIDEFIDIEAGPDWPRVVTGHVHQAAHRR
jgi:two-component system nitrate/nitrite response regulator NarL